MANAQKLSFNRVYLFLLALTPAVGTFAGLALVPMPGWLRFLGFITGTAAVALFLAVTVSYTELSTETKRRKILLLVGPLFWACISLFIFHGNVFDFLTTGALVTVGGTSLAVLLTVIMKAPTQKERLKGVIATGIPVLAVLFSLLGYLKATPINQAFHGLLFLVAFIEHGVTTMPTVAKDRVLREDPSVILVGILSWTAAFIAGNALFG